MLIDNNIKSLTFWNHISRFLMGFIRKSVEPIIDKLEFNKSSMFQVGISRVLWLKSRIVKKYMHLAPFTVRNSFSIDVFWALNIGLKSNVYITRKWNNSSNYCCHIYG